jgi:hypothetical protein
LTLGFFESLGDAVTDYSVVDFQQAQLQTVRDARGEVVVSRKDLCELFNVFT